MAWTYNGIRVYVHGQDENGGQIIARLQPLGATTVLQVFGTEGKTVKIDGVIVGNSNKDALFNILDDGNQYSLVGNDYSTTDLYLSKLSAKRRLITYQTIDTGQSCYAPVFDVSMELMQNAS
jgi:hypothetical protein